MAFSAGRVEIKENNSDTEMLFFPRFFNQTRVVPIKKQGIPCLELLGATILGRLVSKVINLQQRRLTEWFIG